MPKKSRAAQQPSVESLRRIRIAKAEKKQAGTQAQAQAQAQVQADQADLQALYAQLEEENNLLKKQAKNKKKATKRKLLRNSGITVVHASAECEEQDEDVLVKHQFLEGTLPGTSASLDEELQVHLFAQKALGMESSVPSSSSSSSSQSSQSSSSSQCEHGAAVNETAALLPLSQTKDTETLPRVAVGNKDIYLPELPKMPTRSSTHLLDDDDEAADAD